VADVALAVWICALAVLTVYGAVSTTGFMTVSNLKAILTAAAFVGIISVALTVIVLSGNLFSLALGQTVAVTRCSSSTPCSGPRPGDHHDAAARPRDRRRPGFAVGAWVRTDHHHNRRGGPHGGAGGLALARAEHRSADFRDELRAARATSVRVPFPVYVFLVLTVVLEVTMRRTRFGRQIFLMGENRVSARAAALPITLLTTAAFALTSLFTAGAGVLIGATSENASLLLTGSYTYDAIAAALVGGNAVTGDVGRFSGLPPAPSSSRRSRTCCCCAGTPPAGRFSFAGSSSWSSSS